jgi:hypothetical protein
MSVSSMAAKLRVSGTLLLIGLLVTIVSLILRSPLAFLIFAGVGCLSVFAGVAFYLYSLVDTPNTPE